MSESIHITVNGERHDVEAGTSVEALLERMGLPRERLAVERNRRVVRKAAWAETQLADGDSLEIVHFVGGG
jgi:thiamine biosynthesis protein ThiS